MKPAAGNSLFSAIVSAPFGAIGIRADGPVLRELVYLPPHYEERAPSDGLSERVASQIERYLADPSFCFELPRLEVGTPFQRRVWQQIEAIPAGSVATYGQIAKRLGSAPRAVGQACGANWFPLIIPCHRVTAAGGLGGFANNDDETGFHLAVKRWLLRHEGVPSYS